METHSPIHTGGTRPAVVTGFHATPCPLYRDGMATDQTHHNHYHDVLSELSRNIAP